MAGPWGRLIGGCSWDAALQGGEVQPQGDPSQPRASGPACTAVWISREVFSSPVWISHWTHTSSGGKCDLGSREGQGFFSKKRPQRELTAEGPCQLEENICHLEGKPVEHHSIQQDGEVCRSSPSKGKYPPPRPHPTQE